MRDRRVTSHRAAVIRMADVGAKPQTLRRAVAQAELHAPPRVIAAIRRRRSPKGDAIAAAQLAGIQAAKRTWELVPLCHPLAISHVDIACHLHGTTATLVATVTAVERTGVEMEALVAATTAALTLYDMAKALARGMRITNVCLLEKAGGRHGAWVRKAE